MALSEHAALEALGQVKHPDLHKSIVELNMTQDVRIDEAGKVSLTVVLTSPATSLKERIFGEVRTVLTRAGASAVDLQPEVRVLGRDITSEDPIPDVKNIVLVMSGKGGVGKSTVAANLTMALHRSGMRTGLLDADIYGPSVPTMFGVMGRPSSADGKLIEPLERFGIKLMSIGFLLEDPKAAVVWRGPMLHGALLQFVKDVRWGKLDYLVLDLPPGTGDVALTLSQRIRGGERRHRDDAARGRTARRLQVGLDVPEGRHPHSRRRRERELLHLRRLQQAARALRQGRRAEGRRIRGRAAARADPDRSGHPRVGGRGHPRRAGRARARRPPKRSST